MNLKHSTNYFANSHSPLAAHGFLSPYEVFCNMTHFRLEGVQDIGVGLLPKSLLQLGNGDIILATFSSKK